MPPSISCPSPAGIYPRSREEPAASLSSRTGDELRDSTRSTRHPGGQIPPTAGRTPVAPPAEPPSPPVAGTPAGRQASPLVHRKAAPPPSPGRPANQKSFTLWGGRDSLPPRRYAACSILTLKSDARQWMIGAVILRPHTHQQRAVGIFRVTGNLLIPLTTTPPSSEAAATTVPPGHIQKVYTPLCP